MRTRISLLAALAVCLLAASPAQAQKRNLLLIGDSLAVGIQPTLPGMLPGFDIATNARVGRPLAEGMQIIRSRDRLPKVMAVSLFTNDDPRRVDALVSAAREVLRRQGQGCVIWSTIVRPAVGGVSYYKANRALRRLAADPKTNGRLVIVPWDLAVNGRSYFMSGDGVHPTAAGYKLRARMYAKAARKAACDR